MILTFAGLCAIALFGALWTAIESGRIGDKRRLLRALTVGAASAAGLCLAVYALAHTHHPLAWIALPGCRFNAGC